MPGLALALLMAGTALGLAGTDLILPAVPAMGDALSGSPESVQLVLAAYVAGGAVGLILFGELGSRFSIAGLLVASMSVFAATSGVIALLESQVAITVLRAVQGGSSAAAAVLAPGAIRAMFDERRAIRAIGLMGSIESMAPALAPIVGYFVMIQFGWRGTFWVLAAAATVASLLYLSCRRVFPPEPVGTRQGGGYGRLLRDGAYLRYALSQACTLGGLLIFVFAAPAVFTGAMGGGIDDFIIMQVCGIASFVLTANMTHRITTRLGTERAITAGSVLSAAGLAAIFCYATWGGSDFLVVTALFIPVNVGLGMRGPPGFFRAIVAARGDDARGGALVVLFILATTALGTVIVAPFIAVGLMPVAGVAALVSLCSVTLVSGIQPLRDQSEGG